MHVRDMVQHGRCCPFARRSHRVATMLTSRERHRSVGAATMAHIATHHCTRSAMPPMVMATRYAAWRQARACECAQMVIVAPAGPLSCPLMRWPNRGGRSHNATMLRSLLFVPGHRARFYEKLAEFR